MGITVLSCWLVFAGAQRIIVERFSMPKNVSLQAKFLSEMFFSCQFGNFRTYIYLKKPLKDFHFHPTTTLIIWAISAATLGLQNSILIEHCIKLL